MAEVTINNNIEDAGDGNSASPISVFTTASIGYVFTLSSAGRVVYHKTTDGGATWGSAVNFSSFTTSACYPVIWYDQWTPGDTTGTKIHVLFGETGLDGMYYNYLDTASDTAGSEVAATPDLGILTVNDLAGSICKATDGDLFVYGGGSSTVGVYRSANAGGTWATTTASFLADSADLTQLLPLASGAILCIWQDASANKLLSRVYSGAGSWDGADTTINAAVTEDAANDQSFGASLYKSTNDIYLIYNTNASVSTSDVKSALYSGGSWTTKTDLVTDNATTIGVSIVINNGNSDVYALYCKGGTYDNLTDVYYRLSTDDMATWGTETKVSTTQDDIRIVHGNFLSSSLAYAVWLNDDLNDLLGDTVSALSSNITTTKTLTGLSRIQTTATKTITGKARIQVTTTKTLTGVAKIVTVATKTLTGLSRIQKTSTQTVTGISRVTASTSRTITGVANIASADTPPTVALDSPADTAAISDTTPTLTFTGTDV